MINVEVMSRKKFENYAKSINRKSSIVISITSFNDALVSDRLMKTEGNGIKGVYRAVFDDTDEANYGINETQAIEMAYFIKYNIGKVDKIIVHCGAGQSRSAGIAAAILKYYTQDDSKIFDNKMYTPNMRCYRFMLEALMMTK